MQPAAKCSMDTCSEQSSRISEYDEKWMQEQLHDRLVQQTQQSAEPSCTSTGVTFLNSTAQQPKSALQGCPQADAEGIFNAFSPVAVGGIRSLPDALAPNYRQQLYLQLMQRERQREISLQQQRLQSHSTASTSGQHHVLATNVTQDQSTSKTHLCSALGIRTPARYSPMQGYFSTFEHLTSEYERKDLLDKFARLSSKASEVAPESFVVRACPLPAPHTPAFTEFTFIGTPYQEVDHLGRSPSDQIHHQQQLSAHGAFVPPGRSSNPEASLNGTADELLTLLERQFSRDWPKSFIKAFLDRDGAVVLSFDASIAIREGDLSTYMNHQARQGDLILQHRLVKDPLRWGSVESRSGSVFYVMQAPWCSSKQDMPEELLGRCHDKRQDRTHVQPASSGNRNFQGHWGNQHMRPPGPISWSLWLTSDLPDQVKMADTTAIFTTQPQRSVAPADCTGTHWRPLTAAFKNSVSTDDVLSRQQPYFCTGHEELLRHGLQHVHRN